MTFDESLLQVLAVTNTYPTRETPGDTPCIKDQLEALQELGVTIDLLHIERKKRLSSYVQALRQIFSLSFQGRQYDLIHAYYGHCGLIATFQTKYPVVVTFRGSDILSQRDGAIGKFVASLVDSVIVMTDEMKRLSKREDAHIIPFGVNTNVFVPSSKEDARRELGFPIDGKLILFPWDPDRPEKRFDIVQETIMRVKAEHESVELLVLFDQPREIVAKYMNACDALILASDHEGAPMAIREALACDLPVVSVDVGDVRALIEPVTGCYLCNQEPGDLAEKLSLVLERERPWTRLPKTEQIIDATESAKQVISVYESIKKRDKFH
jgi:teichuronic acid biosynthesis glycosyltransferase TuaC